MPKLRGRFEPMCHARGTVTEHIVGRTAGAKRAPSEVYIRQGAFTIDDAAAAERGSILPREGRLPEAGRRRE